MMMLERNDVDIVRFAALQPGQKSLRIVQVLVLRQVIRLFLHWFVGEADAVVRGGTAGTPRASIRFDIRPTLVMAQTPFALRLDGRKL